MRLDGGAESSRMDNDSVGETRVGGTPESGYIPSTPAIRD